MQTHRKVTISLVIIIAAVVAVSYLSSKYIYKAEEKKVSASVIIPDIKKSNMGSNYSMSVEDEASTDSLVPLNDDETLISVVSMDFDGDGYDDQVNAIKTMSSPYIQLLVGLYNPAKSVYERTTVISTEIAQSQSFSYTGIDLTGDHSLSLVYQGFADNGDSILQAYNISSAKGGAVTKIADLRADGTIFIQQLERYEAYEKLKAKGKSFPIWVYTYDVLHKESSEQLQIRYEWIEKEWRYGIAQTLRVPGAKITAKELAKIQNGSVSTFASFLNGLWCKTSDSGEKRYLTFDYEINEIIFLQDDIEEIYNWTHSTLRRNGIYISATNQEIENLQRRVDIALRKTDEIQVRIQDDVRMLISESAVWDGVYKKMNLSLMKSLSENKSTGKKAGQIFEKEKTWRTPEGNLITFENGAYTITTEDSVYNGVYASLEIGGEKYIQFRPDGASTNYWSSELYKVTEKNGKDNSVDIQAYKALGNGVQQSELKTTALFPAKLNGDFWGFHKTHF